LHYLIVSFTHKNTNINTREKLAFSNNLEKETFLNIAISTNYINGLILTSTCNRVEIVASVSDIQQSVEKILEVLSQRSQVDIKELNDIVDIYEDENAVRHLFTVVSSLDSLVIGETQIAGQFKDAFKFSRDNKFTNKSLTRMTNYAFKCAKNVRNTTSLGTGSVSVASAAVAKAKLIFKDKEKPKVLVIGAGEMSELTVRHFLRDGFTVILISRDIKKAQLLASIVIKSNSTYTTSMIEVQPYNDLEYLLSTSKLLVTATSAPYPIITDDMVNQVSFSRYWFDIAIPRDIDTISNKDVNVYAVDDLKDIVDDNLNSRAVQAKEAYLIISSMTKEFYIWIGSLGVEPLIKDIYLEANQIIAKRIDNAISKRFISIDNKENISHLCQTIMNEFLHTSSSNLRDPNKKLNSDRAINIITSLYGIKES